MKYLVSTIGLFCGFGFMFEGKTMLVEVLSKFDNKVPVLLVLATGLSSGIAYNFVKYLAKGTTMTLIVYFFLGIMVYLTIFTVIYSGSIFTGIIGNIIGYLVVYFAKFAMSDLRGENHYRHVRD